MTVEEIFVSAVEKRSQAERAAYLDGACSSDFDQRKQVECLLKAHEEAGDFLSEPLFDPPESIDAPVTEGPGTVIAQYKLLEQIGEGGFGFVFMAEQLHPVRRKVALKVLKPGMDTRQVVARFEAERQALALMDHSNIAHVFDGGETASGRPYFVMELVRGIPITEFCDKNHLSIEQRLSLFINVCQAVQHAHQKGIIHRDLKPSNVLVTMHDDTPVVKVIDFGVAKATGQQLTEKTLFTNFAQFIGTPLYMSPEQAQMSGLDVDTRSDVYSLGVLLYELLTGTTPFDQERLQSEGFDEVRRIIREEEPAKPSTRMSTLGPAAVTVSTNRRSDPARLSRLLRGELDWVVMKALEKDRNRRYESASSFAADVQRYLDDESVQACPPSAGYRLWKFARRNKAALVTASVVLVALLTGTAIATWQAVVATQASKDALAAEANTRTERDKAVTEQKRADEVAAISRAVNDFLQNDLLAEAAPEKNPRNNKVTVEEVLGRAAARVAGKFEKQPRVEAAVKLTIGTTYYRLGDYSAAQPLLESALEIHRRILGEDHLDTLVSNNNLALLYADQGQIAKAESLYIKTLEARRRLLGDEHLETIYSMNNLGGLYRVQGQYAKAKPLFDKALEVRSRVLGNEHPLTIVSTNNLALLYQAQGQNALAEAHFVKILEVSRRVLGDEHPDTLFITSNLAIVYKDQGEFAKAEPLYLSSLEGRRRVLGDEHPETLVSAGNLASYYRERGEYAKAEPLYLRSLEVSRRILGDEHPDTLIVTNNLGLLYKAQGQFAKAEPLFVKTLEVRRRVLGEEHIHTLTSMNNLGLLYQAQGQYVKAEQQFQKALDVSRRVLGEDHPRTLSFASSLGGLFQDRGELAKAEPLLVKTLEARRRVLGEEHHDALITANALALVYQYQSQYAKAEPLFVKILEVSRRIRGDEHPDTLNSTHNLALLYQSQGQLAKAESHYVPALEGKRRVLGDEHRSTLITMSNLAVVYRDQGRYDKAEPLLVKLLEVRRRVLGEDHPDTISSMIYLAGLYQFQGQLPKAEQIYRGALEKSRKRHGEGRHPIGLALGYLGRNLLMQKNYAEAEPLLRESLTIREQTLPDDWATFNTKSQLGACLLDQKQYADAEPLLLAGYEGMKQREAKMPANSKSRLTESLEWLVQLYDATEQKDKSAEWRKILEARTEAEKKEKPKEK